MDKKRKHFYGFHWFWVPTEGWKETCFLKKKIRFSVKVKIYLKSCICLKSENVNIENEGAAGKKIWIFENPKRGGGGGSAHYGDTFIISWNSNISHSITWPKTWGKGPKRLKILNKWQMSIFHKSKHSCLPTNITRQIKKKLVTQLQVALLSFHANLTGPKLVEKNPNGKKYLELIIFLKFEHSSPPPSMPNKN